MKKLLALFILIISCITHIFAQSERKDDYYTRDTAIQVSANGSPKFTYWVRMTTHRGDTTKRPSFFIHNGAGEIGSDTTFFVYPSPHSFGPHFFLSQPSPVWDGGIVLENGTHYPNYFTVMPQTVNMRGEYVLALIDTLVKYYPIELGSMHFSGLSMGSQEWQYMMAYYPSAGQEPGMQLITSMVDLQGEGGQTFAPFQTGPDYPVYMGHWAKKYNGKLFGLEGSNDSRNIWQLTQSMKDSTGTAGYFSYESLGGGTHCCWNSMYDPTVLNWTASPSGNANLVFSTNPASTNGNYVFDSHTGTSVFQWMLRQGDTTLKITNAPNPQNQFVVIGEYTTGYGDSANNVYTFTSNPQLSANGGVGTPGLPWKITVAGKKFNKGSAILHGVLFGTIDSLAYGAGGNGAGQTGIGIRSANVATLTQITTDSVGTPLTGIFILQGGYTNNVAECAYAVKHGSVTDTVYSWGDRRFGMAMNGTLGDSTSRPTKAFFRTGHHVLEMTASKCYAILFDDGQVFTGGANGLYTFLGYPGTGTQYLTPHQVTGFDDSIRHITGGDVGGILCLSKTGKLWGFGPHSGYLGNATDGAYTSPHDLTADISNTIFNVPTRSSYTAIGGNSNCFYIIANDGTQWGWGDNGMGCIGNGVEANMISPGGSSLPWSIDPAAILVLPQTHPVRITNLHNFTKIFSGYLFGFTHFSLTSTGQIIVSGRNKGGVAGNGVIECIGANGDIDANYANSHDIPFSTPISPFALTTNIPMSCPGCKLGIVINFCNECTIPTTTIVARTGGNQIVSGSTTSISAVTSTTVGGKGKIVSYLWTKISGPVGDTIDLQASSIINLTGLTTGTYVYQIKVGDDGFNFDSTQVIITVGSSSLPIVNAGQDQGLTSPTSSTTLSGTAAGVGGASITSSSYVEFSGPNSATIVNGGTLTARTAAVSGLIVGTYIFQLNAGDSNGNSNSDQVQVIVTSQFFLVRKRGYTHYWK